MTSPNIRIKRSAVSGKIPTAGDLPLGELALNTYDATFYASKNVGIGTTVFVVNPWSVGLGSTAYTTFFTAGNVGINSTVPTKALDVNGNIAATYYYGNGSNLTGIATTKNLTVGTRTTSVSISVVGTGMTVLLRSGIGTVNF